MMGGGECSSLCGQYGSSIHFESSKHMALSADVRFRKGLVERRHAKICFQPTLDRAVSTHNLLTMQICMAGMSKRTYPIERCSKVYRSICHVELRSKAGGLEVEVRWQPSVCDVEILGVELLDKILMATRLRWTGLGR